MKSPKRKYKRNIILWGFTIFLYGHCAPELPHIPAEGHVVCSLDEDCPSNYKCNDLLKQCVRIGEDEEGPVLIASSVSPNRVRTGIPIQASFTINEELSTLPEVYGLTPLGDRLPFYLVERQELSFTYEYIATGSEPQDVNISVQVILFDIYGNQTETTAGSVEFDFIGPIVQNVEVLGNTYVKDNDTLRIRFSLTEEASTDEVSVIFDYGPTMSFEGRDVDNYYVYTYTIALTDPEGPVVVTITARDEAGNESTPPPQELFVIDRTPPEIIAVPYFDEVAAEGYTAYVTFTMSEPIDGLSDVDLVNGSTVIPMHFDSKIGNEYTYRHLVHATEDGRYEIAVRAFKDRAGNITPDTRLAASEDKTLLIDTISPNFIVPPELQSFSIQAHGGQFLVHFQIDETDYTTSISLDLGSNERYPLNPVNSDGSSLWYLNIDQNIHPEKSGTIKTQVVDLAGNASSVEVIGPVAIDYTGPSLSLVVEPSSLERPARRGEIVTITVKSALEPLDPASVILDSDGLLSPTQEQNPTGSGSTYIWTYAVSPGDIGSYAFSITAQDLAGNPAINSPTGSLELDGDVPEIIPSSVTLINGLQYSRNTGYETVLLTFESSEALDQLLVTLEGSSMNCNPDTCDSQTDIDRNPVDLKHICCYQFGDADSDDGTKEIRIEGLDRAGNIAGSTTFVEFDNQPPILNLTANPTTARLGELITIALSSQEPLEDSSITLFHNGLLNPSEQTPNRTSSTYFVWTHMVSSDDNSDFDISVEATDIVGNAASTDLPTTIDADGKAPILTNVQTNRERFSLFYPEVIVTFNSSERLTPGIGLQAYITNRTGIPEQQNLSCSETSPSPPLYECRYTFTTDTEAPKKVTILAADTVGNETNEYIYIDFDTTPPILNISKLPNNRPARSGEEISVSVTTSELLEGNSLTVSDGATNIMYVFSGNPSDVTYTQISSTIFKWNYTVKPGDSREGINAPQLTATATDLAGNPASSATLAVPFDGTQPILSISQPSTNRTYSAITGFNNLTAIFTCNENLNLVSDLSSGSGILVTIAGEESTADCSGPTGTGPYQYTCNKTITASFPNSIDGSYDIAMTAQDEATNTHSINQTIIIDRQPPILTAEVQPPVSAFGLGELMQYIVTSNEPLDVNETTDITYITHNKGACPPSNSPDALACDVTAVDWDPNTGIPIAIGNTYTWKRVANAVDAGSFLIEMVLKDTVGNQSSTSLTVISVDPDVPDISNVRVNTSPPYKYSRQTTPTVFNHLEVYFDSLDAFDASNIDMRIIYQGSTQTDIALDCNHTRTGTGIPVDPFVYTCSYDFSATDIDGWQQIRIRLSDTAGNTRTSGTAVILDVDNPVILVDISPANRPARLGETTIISVTSNESLLGPTPRPTVVDNGGLTLLEDPNPVGNTYLWNYTVQPTDQGSFNLVFNATDSVGNGPCPDISHGIVLDGIAPTIDGGSLNTVDNRVKFGPSHPYVDIYFNIINTDPVSGLKTALHDLSIYIGGTSLEMNCSEFQEDIMGMPSSHDYNCRFDLSTQGTGAYELSAFLEDAAGNISYKTKMVNYDETAPQLTVSISPNSRPARLGEAVSIMLNGNEPLDNVIFTDTDDLFTILEEYPSGSGSTYTWNHVVNGSETTGSFLFTIQAEDNAGNGPTLLSGLSVQVDGQPPQPDINAIVINSPTLNNGNYYARVTDTISITIPITEYDLDTANSYIAFDGWSLNYISNDGLGNFTWSRTLTDSGIGTGSRVLEGILLDSAGNTTVFNTLEATTPTIINFDFDAPLVISHTVAPDGAAGIGSTVSVSFSFNEPIAYQVLTNPIVSAAADNTFLTPISPVDGRHFLYQHTVQTGDDGTYPVLITATDLAGNTSTPFNAGSFIIDLQGPQFDLGSGPVVVSPSAVADGDSFDVSFYVQSSDLPLDFPPRMWIGDQLETNCVQIIPTNQFRCTHITNAAIENNGNQVITILLEDLAGNMATNQDALIVNDFQAPQIVTSTITRSPYYAPAEGSSGLLYAADRDPLSGSPVTITATIIANENLDSNTSGFHLIALGSGSSFPFTITQITGNQVSFSYSMGSDSNQANETYTLQLTWTDTLGNSNTIPIDLSPLLVIDNNPTGLILSEVTLTRIPWGRLGNGPEYYLEGTSAAVQESGGKRLGVEIYAYSDNAGNNYLGHTSIDNTIINPSFHLEVSSIDLEIYISLANQAGALTAPVLVTQHQWIASMGFKEAGSTAHNPHTFSQVQSFTRSLYQTNEVEIDGTGILDDDDSSTTTATGSGIWQRIAEIGQTPTGRSSLALSSDTWHGDIIMFGGLDAYGDCDQSGYELCSDTWTWDNAQWYKQTPADLEGDGNPDRRHSAAMAFDPIHGYSVLFGGVGPAACDGSLSGNCDTTWLLTDNHWILAAEKDLTTNTPLARHSSTIFFDYNVGKVVLHGGLIGNNTIQNDVWEWEGSSWNNVRSSNTFAGTYIERAKFATAYHDALGTTIAFGGCSDFNTNGNCDQDNDIQDDLFSWNSTNKQWDHIGQVAYANKRWATAMAYDPIRDQLIIFGGCADDDCSIKSNKTFIFNNSDDITELSPTTIPDGRAFHAMTYDNNRNMIIMTGGLVNNPGTPDHVWGWNGGNWALLAPVDIYSDGTVPARKRQALAATLDGTSALLFGGCANATCDMLYDDTWWWSGSGWEKCPDGAGETCELVKPSALHGHAISYDAGNNEMVLFGGCNDITCSSSPLSQTWIWEGQSWMETCTGSCTKPAARVYHGLAYDDTNAQVVLFGGCDNVDTNGECTGSFNAETWVWDGSSTTWIQKTPVTSPSARAHHTMISANGTVTLFGGCNGVGCLNLYDDIWQWDAAGNTWTEIATSITRPTARKNSGFIYDFQSNSYFVMGGCVSSGTSCTVDEQLWFWDGSNNWRVIPSEASLKARQYHSMFYSNGLQSPIIFGGMPGELGTGPTADTWQWDARKDSVPAHIFKINVNASHITDNNHITLIRINWKSGSQSYAPLESGSKFYIWHHGTWIHENYSPNDNDFMPSVPDYIQWETTDPSLINAMLIGDSMIIHAAMIPESSAGTNMEYGLTTTDYAEAIIQYTYNP